MILIPKEKISFVIEIPGPPISWKAPFVGTRGAYSIRTPVMNELKKIVRPQYDGECIKKSDVGIRLDIDLFFAIPKSTSQKKRQNMLMGEIRPIKRPDRTNCAKFYEDLLHGIVFEDDSIVVEGDIRKYYAETPKTVMKIALPKHP